MLRRVAMAALSIFLCTSVPTDSFAGITVVFTQHPASFTQPAAKAKSKHPLSKAKIVPLPVPRPNFPHDVDSYPSKSCDHPRPDDTPFNGKLLYQCAFEGIMRNSKALNR